MYYHLEVKSGVMLFTIVQSVQY